MTDLTLIDSHAHLDFKSFQPDLGDILERARAAGVEQIVTIGASDGFESNPRALALAEAHPHIFAALGIHPHDASVASEEVIAAVRALALDHPKVVAIGETGLDYHYNNSTPEAQRAAFRRFIQVALELDKPLVVHTREAERDTIDILTSEGGRGCGGIIHCFSGTAWMAEQALALGFYISFSGIVTFKTAVEIHEVARSTPLDRLHVETDAPFLAPIPHRGKRNEPAYVAHTLRFIAALRGMDPADLSRITTANTRRLLKLPTP